MTARIRDDVAWEYLDDGGVLACQLSEGEYWQLGPPAGVLWQVLVDSPDEKTATSAVAEALDISTDEAVEALEAFRESLTVLALVHEDAPPVD